MDTVYVIIGWLSIPVTLVSVIWMVVTWRRERNLTARSLWIPILVSSLSLFLYVRLIGLEVRPLTTWLPLFGALALGVLLGRASSVEADDDRVVASRSPWSFVLWAASFVATQTVALVAPESTEAMLGLLFAATGLTIGEQLALIAARSKQIGQMRSAIAAAAALLLVVALGATLVPRTAHAADTIDLQDVAVFQDDNGGLYEGMPGVEVDIQGVDGVYSGPSIDLTIVNDTADTLKVRVPVGTRLYPDDSGVQTMLAAGDEVIEVAPGQTVTKRIQAYCGEASDRAPSSGNIFTVGEVVTDEALLDSLEEIAWRFNNPDPEESFDTYNNQHDAVWSHTDPETHPPPLEDEEGYDLFNPSSEGPSEQESGTSGGAVGLTSAGTAVLATKPGRGGRNDGKKGSRTEPETDGKMGPKAEAETVGDNRLYTKPDGPKKPDNGGGDLSDQLDFPGSDESSTGTKQSKSGTAPEPTKQSKPAKPPPTGQPAPEQTPEPSAEQPEFQLGPVGITPGSKYTFDHGGTKVSFDDVKNSISYEDSGLKASYDLDNDTGHLQTKDGRVRVDTHRRGGTAVVKRRNGTDTYSVSRDGDKRSVSLNQDRTDGSHNRSYSISSDSTGVTANRTSGNISDTLHVGGDSYFAHSGPDNSWGVGVGDSGFQAAYQQQQRLRMFGEDFDLNHGVTYADDRFNYTYEVQKEFDVNLFNRLDVPIKVNVSGVTGPGSNQRITVGPSWRF